MSSRDVFRVSVKPQLGLAQSLEGGLLLYPELVIKKAKEGGFRIGVHSPEACHNVLGSGLVKRALEAEDALTTGDASWVRLTG